MKLINKNSYFINKFHYKLLNYKYFKTNNNKYIFDTYLKKNSCTYNNIYFNKIELKINNLHSLFYLGFGINISKKKKINNYFLFYNNNYFFILKFIYINIYLYKIILFLLLFKLIYLINYLKQIN